MAEPVWFESAWNGLLLATGGTTLWSWGDYFNHFINGKSLYLSTHFAVILEREFFVCAGNRNWQKSLENPEQHQAVINAAARLVRSEGKIQKSNAADRESEKADQK